MAAHLARARAGLQRLTVGKARGTIGAMSPTTHALGPAFRDDLRPGRRGARRVGSPLLSLVLAGAFASAPIAACDGGADDAKGGLQITTAALVHADCSMENDDGVFPSDADRVVIRVTGGAIEAAEPVVASLMAGDLNAAGAGVVDEIPAGSGMTVEVVACEGSTPSWAGITHGVEVTAARETNVDVFLTPTDEVACVGTTSVKTLVHGHAFAAAWGDGEAAFVAGGFSDYSSGQLRLDATDEVESYVRSDSRFIAGTALSSPRAMALTQPLPDGRARLVGGTTRLLLQSGGRPLDVGADAAPATAFEVYDPAKGTSEGVGAALAALPAAAALGDGSVIAAGGMSVSGEPVPVAWRLPADGADATAIEALTLPEPRFGATVIAAGPASAALIWGGLATYDAAAVALWVDASGDTASVTPLTGTAETGISVFASGAWLGVNDADRHVFVVVGGTDLDDAVGYTLVASTPRLERITIDADAGTFTSESLGDTDLRWQRALPALEAVGDALWTVGGVAAFSGHDACDGAAPCFPGTLPLVALGVDGGVGVDTLGQDLPLGALGAVPVGLGDGSWLIVGGLSGIASGDEVERDAVLIRFGATTESLCDF